MIRLLSTLIVGSRPHVAAPGSGSKASSIGSRSRRWGTVLVRTHTLACLIPVSALLHLLLVALGFVEPLVGTAGVQRARGVARGGLLLGPGHLGRMVLSFEPRRYPCQRSCALSSEGRGILDLMCFCKPDKWARCGKAGI